MQDCRLTFSPKKTILHNCSDLLLQGLHVCSKPKAVQCINIESYRQLYNEDPNTTTLRVGLQLRSYARELFWSKLHFPVIGPTYFEHCTDHWSLHDMTDHQCAQLCVHFLPVVSSQGFTSNTIIDLVSLAFSAPRFLAAAMICKTGLAWLWCATV